MEENSIIDKLDIKAEENMLHSQLTTVSNLGYMALYANKKTGKIEPERTKIIISSAQAAVESIENYFGDVKDFIKIRLKSEPSSIDDRIKEIQLARSLDIMSIDPNTITWEDQPLAGYMAGEVQIIEILVGNLYVTAFLYNEFRECDPKKLEEYSYVSEKYLKIFSNVIRNYELTRHEALRELATLESKKFKDKKEKRREQGRLEGKIRCLPDSENTPSRRSLLTFGYEMFDAKRRGVPNVLQRIKQGEDYSIIYNKEGIHYEHKARGILPNKYRFVEKHLDASRQGKGFSYPETIRALYIDVLPTYEELVSKAPQGFLYT